MKSSNNKVVQKLTAFIMLLTIFSFSQIQAQTCNSFPTAAGFVTAGGYGGCVMQMDIVYDCGSGPTPITCYLDAGGDGFDLPAGCCLLSVVVHTPHQGPYAVDPNIMTGSVFPVPSGLPYPLSPSPCDQHDVHEIHWHFPGGPCDPGEIHIN